MVVKTRYLNINFIIYKEKTNSINLYFSSFNTSYYFFVTEKKSTKSTLIYSLYSNTYY